MDNLANKIKKTKSQPGNKVMRAVLIFEHLHILHFVTYNGVTVGENENIRTWIHKCSIGFRNHYQSNSELKDGANRAQLNLAN